MKETKDGEKLKSSNQAGGGRGPSSSNRKSTKAADPEVSDRIEA